jgi:hypothetical protein
MEAAIEGAIFEGDNKLRWQPNCAEVKCTWPRYFSPAICSKCVNITEQTSLEKDPHNETLSHFQKRAATLFATDPTATEIYDTPLYNQTVIPPDNGLPISALFLADSIWSQSSYSFETTVNFPSDVTWALNSQPQQGEDWTPGTFLGIENPLLAFARISLEWDPDGGAKISEASECVITPCVNEYSTSIEGTQLYENVLSTTYGSVRMSDDFQLLWSATVNGTNMYSTGDDSPDDLGWDGLLQTLSLPISGSETTFTYYNCSLPKGSISALECHVEQTAYSGPTFSLLEYQVIEGYGNFSRVLDNVAGAITDLMHQYGTYEIIGETHVTINTVHIRWVWICLPVFLLLIGIMTLLLGVLVTRERGMPVWKLSSLPLLCRGPYRGLMQTTQGSDLSGNKVSAMEDGAAQMHVQLEKQEGDPIWILQRHLEDSDQGRLSRVTPGIP